MGTITHGWPSHLPIIHYIHYFTTNTAFCQTRIRTWSWILKYIILASCMLYYLFVIGFTSPLPLPHNEDMKSSSLPPPPLSSSPSYAHIKYRTKWSNQW